MATQRPEDTFSARPLPSAPPRPARGNFLTRYVLPIVLFVAIVAGVAWVVQNLPSRGKTESPVKIIPEAGPALLQFARTSETGTINAVWGTKDHPVEVHRSEINEASHYDFPFRNVSGKEVEFGLDQPSCDCVSIQAALLPKAEWEKADRYLEDHPGGDPPLTADTAWVELERSPDKGILIPPDGQGLLRVNWKSRKAPGQSLNLTPKLWSQPKGERSRRHLDSVMIPTESVALVDFVPDRHSVGILETGDTGRAVFYFYSLTRDDIPDLKVQEHEGDPLFEVDLKKLSKAEFPEVQNAMPKEKKGGGQIRCAYRAIVLVHEHKDGKEMELGPFWRNLTIFINGFPHDRTGPMITGLVRGDVQVGVAEDRGRIPFESFSASLGKRVSVPLTTKAGDVLELTNNNTPPALVAKLIRNEDASTKDRNGWRLEVAIPPGSITGALPEDAAVVLRIVGPRPRIVRIPVTGNANDD